MRAHRSSLAGLWRYVAIAMTAGIALIAFSAAAHAQQGEDPPSRVGRVSDLRGEIYGAPDDPNADWQPIGLNYPITIGDNVWTGADSRVEIDFGAGHVRLARETNVHFSQLDDSQLAAFLAEGRVIVRMRSLEAGEVAHFDTAAAQVDLLRPGTYRIETDRDGTSTVVVVREGEAEVRTADGTALLRSGQTATVSGTGYGAAVVVRDGFGSDGFDTWSLDRDARLEAPSTSSQYVSTFVPGVRDLDYYGSWDNVPNYGAVWYPTSVSVDWVPYRDGSWTYVRPWGWTWVDSAPWGWVPFHYGRWVRIGPRWAWCPGEFVRRPVYAPALVAWYGGAGGTSWSASIGGPAYGWVPLAWGEPYWPHYRYSSNYWRGINRPYAVNVQRLPTRPVPNYVYSNMRIGALTVAPSEALATRRPIASSRITVPPQAMMGVTPTTTMLGVRPVARPAAADARPRGAPPPASALIGRTRIDAAGPRAPNDTRIPGRPGIAPQAPAPAAPAPAFGGSRQPLGERPSASSPPAFTPAPGRDAPRPVTPSPAPSSAAPFTHERPSATITSPAPTPPTQQPAFTPAPANPSVMPSSSPQPRPAPATRIVTPDAPPQVAPRAAPREPTFQRPAPMPAAPAPAAPVYVPAPAPAQVAPAPGPAPARPMAVPPAQGQPFAAPIPAPATQPRTPPPAPGQPGNPPGRPDMAPSPAAGGQLPR